MRSRLTTARIARHLRWSSQIQTLIPIWGFLDEHTFITKAGGVGAVYRIGGVDPEGLDVDAREAQVRHVEGFLKALGPDDAFYQYLWKRPTDGGLFVVETYAAIVHEGLHPPTTWREWWSPARTRRVLATDLARAEAALQAATQALEAHLGPFHPRRFGKADVFRWFRALVHEDPIPVRLTADTHVDAAVCDVGLEVHRDHLQIGETRVQALAMTEAPAATFAAMLEDLTAVPGAFVACLDWQRLTVERARLDLHHRRRHFARRQTPLLASALAEPGAKAPLGDTGAEAAVTQLGGALAALEVEGHCFGAVALTIVCHGPTGVAVVPQLRTVFAAHDGRLIEETYNLLPAWAGILPGNRAFALRRLALLETHTADLSFIWSVDAGRPRDDAGRPPVLVLPTQQQTPYPVHLHVFDVGHALVLGATGSGKTYLLRAIADAALHQYAPRLIVFDIGHGYRDVAAAHHGSYIELGLRGVTPLNPWTAAPTPEHLHFLAGFVRMLLDTGDPLPEALARDLPRELYAACAALYALPPAKRRLGSLLVPRPLQARLAQWTQGGRYGEVFDHPTDALEGQACQVYDFSGLDTYPELVEPLLFYLLHHVSIGLTPDVLTLCLMDEAWKFVRHPTLRAYVQGALKTWRKQNGAVVLATQAIEDFGVDDFLRTVVESCPTQFLLYNPTLARAHYARLLNLNEQELELLARLVPRKQVLMKRHGFAKVLNVEVACVA